MPGVPQCPQLPLAQVPVGSGPKTGTGNDMQEAPLPYPLLHSHKHISRSTHEGICHTGLGCTSTLSSDCSTSFVCWELRMHMRRTRTSNSGTILVVQSNFEGDGTALRKMPISKGNPMWQKGISEAEALMYPCVTSMLHCRHRCKARTCKTCTGRAHTLIPYSTSRV